MTHVTLIWLIKHGNGEPHKLSLIWYISAIFPFKKCDVQHNIPQKKQSKGFLHKLDARGEGTKASWLGYAFGCRKLP